MDSVTIEGQVGNDGVTGAEQVKAVMLCERPVEAHAAGVAEANQPFCCRAVPGQVGLHFRQKEEESKVKSKVVNPATGKHRKFLTELQESCKQMKEDLLQQQITEKNQKDRIAFIAKRQRELVKGVKQDEDVADKAKALHEALAPKKPKWALTEQQVSEVQDADDNELVDFACNLEFDKFIHDLEFKQALCILKDRCGTLERQEQAFRAELVDEFNRAEEEQVEIENTDVQMDDLYAGSASEMARQDWNLSFTAGESHGPPDAELAKQVEELLQKPEFKSVHSKASITSMLKSQLESPNPVIAHHGSTDQTGVDPSNLPYLHRNPAV